MTAQRNIGKDTILLWEDLNPPGLSDLTQNDFHREQDGALPYAHPKRHHV